MRAIKTEDKKKLTSTMIYNVKKYLFLSLIILFSTSIAAQNIGWDKSFGGINSTGVDIPMDIHELDNGGFIVTGIIQSDDGDVSFNHGFKDFWILKLDENGNLVWEKTFGGSSDEAAYSIQEGFTSSIITSDNTILMTSYTRSDDGDVSDKTISSYPEIWVINVDLDGNLLWEETYIFDQVSSTEAYDVTETSNGDFVIAGTVNHNSNTIGFQDFFILRIDSNGNLLWDKNYGGTDSDVAQSVVELVNGDIMVVGTTESDDVDITLNYGMNDIWIVKLNNNGDLIWEKNFGGSDRDGGFPNYRHKISAVVNQNGNITIATKSESNDFDVQSGIDPTDPDIWVFQIDSSGSIIWEQVFGGDQSQQARDIILADSNDFFIIGTTSGLASRDIDEVIGFDDTWIIKIDNNGSLIWEHTFGGTSEDIGQSLVHAGQNKIVGISHTRSNDVDVSNNPDDKDYWVFKSDVSVLGINEASFTNSTQAYPNPTRGRLSIQIDNTRSEKILIKVTNILGKEVLNETRDIKDEVSINISGNTGIYFLEIKDVSGARYVEKIMKID